MSTQPPIIPNVQVPTQQLKDAGGPPAALEDRDNFVRNLGTVVGPLTGGSGTGDGTPALPVTPSDSASSRPPVLTLVEIKMHCRIESDQTAEDAYLASLEMAARLHTENYLRYQIDATVGENIKQAMLILIAQWYRSRENMVEGRWIVMPQAFAALLSAERDYPTYT